MVFKK